jgi:formylglycine-generating enzyme required for sulfatase activity
MSKLTIIHEHHQVQHFVEDLNGVPLQMILIPEGKFIMGSSQLEEGSDDNERPQHPVEVSSFFMGRYPITNAQWNFVVRLPQQQLDLKDSKNQDNHPVVDVSWYDAMEFCARLSIYTKKNYRLPSEAEWEYACRAGTTTPFHFGETISTELANYDGNHTYGRGEKGDSGRGTTAVDCFKVANAFGLSDMHGNVWEWCEDDWHKNYEGAPTDGSAWRSKDSNRKVLRGGSWYSYPTLCRSAFRDTYDREDRGTSIGFRIMCVAFRTT